MDCQERNILLEKCLGRMRLIARQFESRLPPGVELVDLVNEAAVRMAEHLDRGLPWTWARVQGAMADFLREHSPARRGEMPVDVASGAPDPEQLAIGSERRRILQRNAATLTPREAALVRLAGRGLNGARIAQELRVSGRRARKIRQAAVARLGAAVA
jgi:RNA polymerase sigma factor (sigma-70 family)